MKKIRLFDVGRRPNEKPAAGVFFWGGGGHFVKKKFPFFFPFLHRIGSASFVRLTLTSKLGNEHVVRKAYN